MNVLTLYIVREVLKGSALAMLILLTLFNLFTFSDELRDIGHGNYGLQQILTYLMLTSPRVFFELVPSAALLGSLFVVGSMANNREVVAMRAVGLSTGWIIRSIMLAGLVLVTLAVLVGEFVAPDSEKAAQLLKSTAQNNGVVMRTQYGMWLREGNRFINVRQINDDGSLGDIRIYEIDDQRTLQTIAQSDQARFLGNQQWQLSNVRQSTIAPGQIRSEHHDTLPWQSSIDSDLLKVAVVNSDNLALHDLFNYIQFLKANNQKSQSFELAFWSRLVNPLVVFVMLMVSLPFVIGIGRGVSAGGRILIGVLIGMTFNIFDRIAGHVGLVYDMNPMLMAVLPSLLVFMVASYAVWRLS
ncbi:MAG: LPS export ABC transporter permease LptG [Methylomonas sp.]|nr:LPS export ABC transporter permease LptG [Methylomonas sp.]PPD20031.1 MAG: LPS export ABC transporter permease LptG [Methylomonas sp.]PPD25894.1 MAG: LPS export ABC transporter permease LptG [Methylomonas sp.]PPD37340.1 MAG: LPS export ABC transporter permease LptG [Methylomonas sp.]PPD40118.1 MAG: LPS export ABC transporter permease LptG [Methylomonas sp.]